MWPVEDRLAKPAAQRLEPGNTDRQAGVPLNTQRKQPEARPLLIQIALINVLRKGEKRPQNESDNYKTDYTTTFGRCFYPKLCTAERVRQSLEQLEFKGPTQGPNSESEALLAK